MMISTLKQAGRYPAYMAEMKTFSLVLLVVLLLASAGPAWAAPNQQHAFLPSSPSSSNELSDTSKPAPPLPSAIRLSHAGLYVNSARYPYAKSEAGVPFPPHSYLTLYVDLASFDASTVRVLLSEPRIREWDEVTLSCGTTSGRAGGLESCEADDLVESRTRSEQGTLDGHECKPAHTATDGRLLFDPKDCPPLRALFAGKHQGRTNSSTADDPNQERLTSLTLSVAISSKQASHDDRTNGTAATHASMYEEHYWIGHLRKRRAGWPLAGFAHGRDGTLAERDEERAWTGDGPNRVAGLMEDPYIPRASGSDGTPDDDGQADAHAAHWHLGLSIRVPLDEQKSLPSDLANKEDYNSTSYELVHAPVAGQVVWVRPYRRHMAPASGDGVNDEKGWCVMIRDEWGFVWQMFGMSPRTLRIYEGQYIREGHVLGGAPRRPLSAQPPDTDPPADPPKKPTPGTPKYPFRFREVQLNVARPNPVWKHWQEPYVSGWQYFNPLHLLSEGNQYQSTIPPNASPSTLFFARAGTERAFASSEDFFMPTLAGDIDIHVGFASFLETPGDAGDALDPLALYALEWAAWKSDGSEGMVEECGWGYGLGVPTRSTFEHAKLPNAWTSLPASPSPSPSSLRSKLWSVYRSSFSYGFFVRTLYSSQFDEKARRLFYTPTAVIRGEPDARGTWHTRDEGEGNGRYRVVVRARDYWGNTGCIGTNVMLRNFGR